MNDAVLYIVPFAILLLAFLYSSVGHGGASAYLAIMALFGFDPSVLRPSALMLNIIVSGIAFIMYYKKGHFNRKLFLPFAISSVPMAFVGGSMAVSPDIYKNILGICLVVAVLRLMGVFGKFSDIIRQPKWLPALIIGAILGFFSGLIGIGGGIILSPVILLLHWGKMKETAAVSALFIWVNSLSGMSGLLYAGDFHLYGDFAYWVLPAVAGGLLGSWMGSVKINSRWLMRVLAAVLVFAGFKLVFL